VTGTPARGAVPPGEDVPTPLSAGHYHSFVVRVFSRGSGPGLVEGQVTHIASRSTLRFRDLQGIVGFIRAQLDKHPPTDAELAEPEVVTRRDG
jgi:hypothetical protein